MSEQAKEAHQELRKNLHGILSFLALVIGAVLGLLTSEERVVGLLGGLLLASVFISGQHAGGVVLERLEKRDADQLLPPKIFAAVISGVIVAILLVILRGILGLAPNEDDSFIIAVVKHLFYPLASVVLGLGVFFGALAPRQDA